MILNLVCVGLGGALGSVARYVLSHFVAKTCIVAFPWGTLVVNVAGCLLVGFLSGLVSASPSTWRLLLVTGFCGGFTTFSTFASESVGLVNSGQAVLAALNVGVSVTAGVAAVYGGQELARYVS